VPVQFNSFLQMLTRSSRISEAISPLLLFVIIHFLNCHLYFYCIQEWEALWLLAGVMGLLKLWALQWVSSNHSMFSVNARTQLYSMSPSNWLCITATVSYV